MGRNVRIAPVPLFLAPFFLASFFLAPVLLIQALRTRKNALILPEPDGPRSGQIGTGPALRLLILGDSSGAGVGVAHQNQALSGQLTQALAPDFSVTWQTLARTGATTADALDMLDQAAPMDVAVLALGVNDVTRLTSARRFVRLQSALIDRLTTLGARLICVTAIPPMGEFPLLPNPLRQILGHHAARLQHARATHLAGHPACRPILLDLPKDPGLMARDGFHPGPQIYARWADTTAQTIRAAHPFILP